MSFYTEMQGVAANLIDEFGVAVTYKAIGQSVPTPSTPWVVSDNDTTYALRAVKEPVKLFMVDGVTIHATDVWYLVPAASLAVVPKAGDRIVDGSKNLTVKLVEQIGSEAVVYSCLARA